VKRILALASLLGFLAYTGIYVGVYLARAFRIERPRPLEYVGIYHGDDFSRVLLVGILFLIGQVLLLTVLIAARRPRRVEVRSDLWAWLEGREAVTGDPPRVTAESAIAQYRVRLEGGAEARLPAVPSSGREA
jgi:hypothetical protein